MNKKRKEDGIESKLFSNKEGLEKENKMQKILIVMVRDDHKWDVKCKGDENPINITFLFIFVLFLSMYSFDQNKTDVPYFRCIWFHPERDPCQEFLADSIPWQLCIRIQPLKCRSLFVSTPCPGL